MDIDTAAMVTTVRKSMNNDCVNQKEYNEWLSEKMKNFKSLSKYTEWNPSVEVDLPSIRENISDQPFPGEDKVISYLKNGRETGLATGTSFTDCFSGERIARIIHYTDGEWTWTNAVTYHVEKYHLRLPDDFVKKVINDSEE